MSKFASAKPKLDKPIGYNSAQLKHPALVKPKGKGNRAAWVLDAVIHKGKRFSADAIKEKGFQPKAKHISYICYSSVKEEIPYAFFCYAMRLEDGSYKPTSWPQEKKLLAEMSFRNDVKFVRPKSAVDLERIKAYGNRLPRVDVLASPQPLHNVGFISDRYALKELGLESLADLQPQNKLLFGERGPYIPKYLAALAEGVEHDNDELEVEEDEEEEDEELEEEGDGEDDDDDDDDADEDEDENNAPEDDMDVDEQSHSSEGAEKLQTEMLSARPSATLRGGKYTEIAETISRTDMLARVQQLSVEGSGHTQEPVGERSAQATNNKKRKSESAVKEAVPKKQKPTAKEPSPKKSKPTAKSPAKATAPAETTKTKKAAPPKPITKKSQPLPKPKTPKKVPSAAAAVQSSDEGWHTSYPTVERIEEGLEKLKARPDILASWTNPDLVSALQQSHSLNNLLLESADPVVLSVMVPFLYEFLARHHKLPVPDPSKVNVGQTTSVGLKEAADALLQCSTWQEAIAIANNILEKADEECSRESREQPLLDLINTAIQERDSEALVVLHSIVFAENVQVRVGISALGEQKMQQYVESIKSPQMQKMLLNLYLACQQYAGVTEAPPEAEPEEEFSLF